MTAGIVAIIYLMLVGAGILPLRRAIRLRGAEGSGLSAAFARPQVGDAGGLRSHGHIDEMRVRAEDEKEPDGNSQPDRSLAAPDPHCGRRVAHWLGALRSTR